MHFAGKAGRRSLNGPKVSLQQSRCWRIFRLVTALLCTLNASWCQNSTNHPSTAPRTSLFDSLQRAGSTQLHIFYLHGIGANGPDHDSQLLRTSICKFLHCAVPIGQLEGSEYADSGSFAATAQPPQFKFMGQAVWESDPSGGPSKQWQASAPYVDHWKLVGQNGPSGQTGPIVYVDEINWWPLVFALKCRQIVAADAELVGPSASFIDLCSGKQKTGTVGGPVLYPWIDPQHAQRLKALPSKGALVNRTLKNSLLDWGFSDALLAVGSLQPFLVEGIRELILKSVKVAADGSRKGSAGLPLNQEFVIVAHSLGSYLIFSALDLGDPPPECSVRPERLKPFEHVLSRTPVVYFFANQLRLLELANLDASDPKGKMIKHLENWSKFRHRHLTCQADLAGQSVARARIVALSDPSDLLTWNVPDLNKSFGYEIDVENSQVRNAINWFWLLESPAGAHRNYAANKTIIRTMLKAPKT